MTSTMKKGREKRGAKPTRKTPTTELTQETENLKDLQVDKQSENYPQRKAQAHMVLLLNSL